MQSATKRPLAVYLEDNPDDQEIFRMALEKNENDFDVHFLSSGQSAIKYIDEIASQTDDSDWPDLFLLDIAMPGVDGWDVLIYFRSHPKLQNIPVVIFSTSNSKNDMEQAISHGANAYIAKPMHLSELDDHINTTLTHWLKVASVDNLD